MHDSVGEIAVIGEQEQAFGVAVEAANRVDALRHVDEFHHRPALALVVDRGDKTRRLVEHDDPRPLRPQDLAIDPDLGGGRVDPGAKFSHDLAIDLDTAGGNQRFR